MKISEAAVQLNKSEETIRRYIRTGRIKAKMTSRKHGYDIPQKEIDKFIKIMRNKDLETLITKIDMNIENHKIAIADLENYKKFLLER